MALLTLYSRGWSRLEYQVNRCRRPYRCCIQRPFLYDATSLTSVAPAAELSYLRPTFPLFPQIGVRLLDFRPFITQGQNHSTIPLLHP